MQDLDSAELVQRLSTIEEKLDACLVLLKVATTHDSFIYSFKNRSARFVNAIMAAQGIASHSVTSVAERHPEHDWDWCTGAVPPDPAEMGTGPNGMVELESVLQGPNQEAASSGHRREAPDPN